MENWKRILLRSAGFGAGFALIAAVVVGGVVWWQSRPPKQTPWSDSAITAKYTLITLHNEGEELHLSFEYSLTNHTNAPYSLPGILSGTLMRRIPKEASLDKFDSGSWDDTLVIPPGQNFNVKFNVV